MRIRLGVWKDRTMPITQVGMGTEGLRTRCLKVWLLGIVNSFS